jgi:hypothetical protein
VKKTDGTPATTFGETAEAAYIRQQINRIWAQVGVRIDWLPFTDYISDFAYQGSSDYSVNPRPDSDLEAIVNGAGSPPKSANAIVINLFFVGIAPGFPQSEEFSVNGRAFLDSNGVALYVGEELLTFEAGLDGIAAIAAHEIGHNLGLDHYDLADNLMNTFLGETGYLTNGQNNIIFTNDGGTDGFEFLQVAPPPSNYSQWATTHGLAGGPEGDDDLDHIDNVIEFMLGLNPNASSTLPVPVSAANGLTWTFPKNAAAVADGLVYQVQSANTAGSWLAAGAVGSGSTVVTNNSSSLVVRLDSGGIRRFMRLNVDSTPVASGAGAAFILPASNPEFRVLPATGCRWAAPGRSSPP